MICRVVERGYVYRRVTALSHAAGWSVNHKHFERIWRRENLKVLQKQPKRRSLWHYDRSCIRLRPEYPDHVLAYDFVEARTHDGCKFRILAIIDEARLISSSKRSPGSTTSRAAPGPGFTDKRL